MKKLIELIVLVLVLSSLTACTEYEPVNNAKDDIKKAEENEKQLTEQITEPEKKDVEPLKIPIMDIVYGPSNPKYIMDFSYNRKEQTIAGTMNVTFTNNIKDDLDKIYFNLWPNAETYKKAGSSIEVDKITVDGQTAAFKVEQTHLEISGLSLKKEQKANVSLNVKVTIPEGQDRFGYYESTVSLGNWFPILAVHDDEGWNVDPFFPYGESFYSLTSDFDVKVTTEPSEVIVATGLEVDKSEKDGMVIHHFQAKDVRDFAIEMDPNYQVKKTSVDGIDINLYYTKDIEEYADTMLETGKGSIALYNEKFGKYPWPELDLVTMKGWFGGMEYPQLVMISFRNNRPDPDWINLVIAHEIGHQWFYGVLGNNQYDEPWLDESFATFASGLYLGNLDQTRPVFFQEGTDYHLTSPVSAFPTDVDKGKSYYSIAYDYGKKTLNDLRLLLGDDVFYKTLQEYYIQKQFKISTTAEMMKAFMNASERDLTEFFKEHHMYIED